MSQSPANKEAWRQRVNFYAFVADLLGEGDIYPPTEFARKVSERRVVDAWKGTVRSIRSGTAPSQLGIFVFVPFCRTKCFFCPFFSFPLLSQNQLDIYTGSLIAEMELFKGVFKDGSIREYANSVDYHAVFYSRAHTSTGFYHNIMNSVRKSANSWFSF